MGGCLFFEQLSLVFTIVWAGMGNAIYFVHTEFEPTLKQTIKYVKLKRSVQLEELG